MKKYSYMVYHDARRRLPNAEAGAAEINMPFPPLKQTIKHKIYMKYLRNILLILCITAPYACDDDNGAIKVDGGYAACEDRAIVKVLKNEQASVRKSDKDACGNDTFYFELAAGHSEFFNTALIPCDSIPIEYQIDYLSVRIGGNVTSCMTTTGDCSDPYVRLAPLHIFELRTIKIDKQ
jgi:hypothetical protein